MLIRMKIMTVRDNTNFHSVTKNWAELSLKEK